MLVFLSKNANVIFANIVPIRQTILWPSLKVDEARIV